MKALWLAIGIILILIVAPVASAYNYAYSTPGYGGYGRSGYGGYTSYGRYTPYGAYGSYGGYDRYGKTYRYGYGTGYERYAPGTWASGQNAINQWPGQWTGVSPRNTYGYASNYGGSNYYARSYYSPFTNARFIPPWKYPQYYGY